MVRALYDVSAMNLQSVIMQIVSGATDFLPVKQRRVASHMQCVLTQFF